MATSTPPAVHVRAPSGPRAVAPSPAPEDIQALPAFPPEHQQPQHQPPPPPQQEAAYLAAERTPSPGPVPVQLQPTKSGNGQAPDGEQKQAPASPVTPRRSSFSFLRRGKSVERLNSGKRSTSGAKLTKKQIKERELQAQREAAMLPKEPPKLPAPAQPAPLQTFGGDVVYSASSTVDVAADKQTVPPMPPMPGSHKGAFVDPYARTESMTNRGRYSYASSTVSTLNSPRRIRRRKDPTPFNVLVVGAKNSGKTAFIDFLRTALALPARKQPARRDEFAPELNQKSSSTAFKYHFLETESSDGERVGLTIWDSEGFEKNIIDLQLREVAAFLESKFEDTLNEELKVVRSPGARDTHIHAVFLLLDPVHLEPRLSAAQKAREASRNGQFAKEESVVIPPSPMYGGLGSLDDHLDLQVLRMLQGKTTVIPVISKADTVPQEYMVELKRSVGESMRQANLDPLESLSLEEEDDDEEDSSEEEAERKRAAHRRHDSKKFDERDEDRLLPSESAVEDEDDRSNQSVLDLTSSSSATSVAAAAASKKKGLSSKPEGPDTNLFLPLSIISPYPITDHAPKPGQVGRKFAWGFADPYEPDHCDFVRLKEAVFREWRDELREASRELWYERWRTHRLHHSGGDPRAKGRAPGSQPAGRGARNGARVQAAQQHQQQHPPQHGAKARPAQWPLA